MFSAMRTTPTVASKNTSHAALPELAMTSGTTIAGPAVGAIFASDCAMISICDSTPDLSP